MWRIFESWGLFHVDRLLMVAVEKCCLEVDLAPHPVACGKEAADETQSLQMEGWGKDFLIVYAMYLQIAHGDKPGFEFLYQTVGAMFYFKHPLRFDDFSLVGSRYDIPCSHA
jgi:hypothetical protein